MEAIFWNNENSLVSRILGLFTSSSFSLNKYNMLVDSFLICFSQFYFLTENDDFEKDGGHFGQLSKHSFFQILGVFSSSVLHKISIVCL